MKHELDLEEWQRNWFLLLILIGVAVGLPITFVGGCMGRW